MLSPEGRNYKTLTIMAKIFSVFDIILLILAFIITFLSSSFKKFPEIPPKDIYITGLKSFSFTNNSTKIPYKYGMQNLGKTKNLKFECYSGYCQKYVERNYDFKYESYSLFLNFLSSKINSIENKDEINHKNKNNDIKTFYIRLHLL